LGVVERLGEIEGENLHLFTIYDALQRFTWQFFSLRNLAEARARYIFSIFVLLDVLRVEGISEKVSRVTKFFNCAKIKAARAHQEQKDVYVFPTKSK